MDYALITPALLPAICSAGYNPFNYRIPSDHRAFFLDFDTQLLLGYKPSALAPATYHDFHSRQLRVVAEYITTMIDELANHDFWTRIAELQNAIVPCTNLAESLDRDLT